MDSILIKNLRFKWSDTDINLLDIKELRVEQNKSLFIQGKSGSGKSTFLSLLAGILVPDSGGIEILGQDLADLTTKDSDKFRADHMGYIFQMFNLLPYLSVIDNVILPCDFSKIRASRIGTSDRDVKEEAKRLLNRVGLTDQSIFSKKPHELSLGQQQRVAACRALIGSPEILIADEPTSALDADSQNDFLRLLSDECSKNNITMVFVSHDNRLASHFDNVAYLVNGQFEVEPAKNNQVNA